MKRFLLAILLALAACDDGPPQPPKPESFDLQLHRYGGIDGIAVFHDPERRVTCWIYYGNGLSCLPDKSFAQP